MEPEPSKDLYNVEEILAKRNRNKKREYKVKWEGYPLDQSTWEPIEHLKSVLPLVQDFEKKNSRKEEKKLLNHKKHRDKSNAKEQSPTVPLIEKNANILKNIDKLIIKDVLTVTVFDAELHGEIQYSEEGKMRKAWVSTKLLKKAVPQLLIDYYEKQIIFN